jgi:short-chain Z-isoprenyl diphosphate synthase
MNTFIKHYIKPVVKSIVYPLYERRLLRQLDFSQTPHHIGVILDGNRRWSKANPSENGDVSSARGHKAGAEKIINLLSWCEEVQVKVVTLWLLSNQNLNRPNEELAPLLEIIGSTVDDLAATHRWEIRPVGINAGRNKHPRKSGHRGKRSYRIWRKIRNS